MNRYFVNISGGGIKFIGLLVAFITLVGAGINIVIGSGVSAGGLVMFLWYTGKLNTGMLIARQTFDPRIIFSKRNDPQGKIGGLSIWAIYKLVRKRNYIGKMDNLEKNLRNIITSDQWTEVQKKSNVDCYIHCIDEKTHKKVSFNLRYLSYEQAIDVVIGSASIAPVVPARKTFINGYNYSLVDGGHRDPSAGSHLLQSGIVKPSQFDKCLTIWSRSKPSQFNETSGKATGNILDRLMNTTIGMPMREASVNDEELELDFCLENGKTHDSIYVDIKSEGTYKITQEQIELAEVKATSLALEYIDTLD